MAAQQLLSVRDTSEALGGLSKAALYRLIAAGELKVVKIGRRTFLRAGDVEEFVERLQAR